LISKYIHSAVYFHIVTICTFLPPLKLANEKTGSEEADSLGEDVFRHDVDERRNQDKGHGGFVDEEKGN
jgi:hypothetical protein